MAGPGAGYGSGVQLEHSLEGWEKGRPMSTRPPSLPLPRLHPTRPGPSLTGKGEGMPVIATSRLPCEPGRAVSLGARCPHLSWSRRFPSCSSGQESGAGRRRGGSGERRATRCGQGLLSLCPSEAASLSALRADLPARLGWVAANATAPRRRERGGSF